MDALDAQVREGGLTTAEVATIDHQVGELTQMRRNVLATVDLAQGGLAQARVAGLLLGAGDVVTDTVVATANLAYDAGASLVGDDEARGRMRERLDAVIYLVAHIDELPAAIAADIENRMAEAARLSEAGDIVGANRVLGELGVELATAVVPTAGVGVGVAAAINKIARASGGRGPDFGSGGAVSDWPELSGMLRDSSREKGNFGIGSGTREQAQVMGEAWVGPGFRTASDGKTLVSADGLRQYRPPSTKPNSARAPTGVQANFERREFPSGNWTHNGHLDIMD